MFILGLRKVIFVGTFLHSTVLSLDERLILPLMLRFVSDFVIKRVLWLLTGTQAG